MLDSELESMVAKATAVYGRMTPEQRYHHDRAQAISFAYGNCKLDGSTVTEEQVAATWDKSHYPFGMSMWTAAGEWCVAASYEDAAKCYEEAIGEPCEPVTWTEEPPDADHRFRDEDGGVAVKTNAEWVRERGRGHFGSANI